MDQENRKINPCVGRELLSQKPGIYLFQAREGHGLALPFRIYDIEEDRKYSAHVYDCSGNSVEEHRVLDKDALLGVIGLHSSEYVLITRLQPELADILSRRGD